MEKRKHRKRQKSGFFQTEENQDKNPPTNRNADGTAGGHLWLYGRHAVTAALANPKRHVHRILLRKSADFNPKSIAAQMRCQPEKASNREIEALLPDGAVHQGWALEVSKLGAIELDDLLQDLSERAETDKNRPGLVILLDQITDPQNVGAILRSAAAFAADAVILTARNAAPESGPLAKAASGALDQVPLLRVTNLARALGQLAEAGFWRYGLDGDGARELAEIDLSGPTALVMGAEGRGLRRLTMENCDEIAHLPISPVVESLNVSNAAAIALYEAAKARRR
jgi:23S rRNA (guanosine2251-2'-O)-methyltransferase